MKTADNETESEPRHGGAFGEFQEREETQVTLISRFTRKADPRDVETHGTLAPAPTADVDSVAHNYCRLLTCPLGQVASSEIETAWKILRQEMALVPEGDVLVAATDSESLSDVSTLNAYSSVWVESFYMDRACVTNEQFAQFVAAGGYAQENLWPPEILSNVLQFVDSTGCAGPADWVDGHPPRGKAKHPVTGICWYEANAYAHWRGKRLASPAEWQWAATWAGGQKSGVAHRKYPWGDSFDPQRCNTWNSGLGATVPVDEYYSGCTPNGIYQLIGNVWEWTSALFECEESANGDQVLTECPVAEVRGGAFDTYFASQCTAQFRTCQTLLFRGANVGFRCCVSGDQLAPSSDPYSFLDDESKS